MVSTSLQRIRGIFAFDTIWLGVSVVRLELLSRLTDSERLKCLAEIGRRTGTCADDDKRYTIGWPTAICSKRGARPTYWTWRESCVQECPIEPPEIVERNNCDFIFTAFYWFCGQAALPNKPSYPKDLKRSLCNSSHTKKFKPSTPFTSPFFPWHFPWWSVMHQCRSLCEWKTSSSAVIYQMH